MTRPGVYVHVNEREDQGADDDRPLVCPFCGYAFDLHDPTCPPAGGISGIEAARRAERRREWLAQRALEERGTRG